MRKIIKIFLLFLPLVLWADTPVEVVQSQNRLDLIFNFSIRVDENSLDIQNGILYSLSNSIDIFFPFNIAIPTNNNPQFEYKILKSKRYNGKLKYFDKEVVNNDFPLSLDRIDLTRDNWVAYYKFFPILYDSSKNETIIIEQAEVLFKFNGSITTNQLPIYDDDIIKNIVLNYSQAKQWKISQLKLNKINSSIYKNNKFYRFSVKDEGIYIIRANQLADYGIDKNTVDPRTIKIYSFGGIPLKENFNGGVEYEPRQITIEVVGEEDGKFDDNDYIIFYARGVEYWQSSNNSTIFRNRNPYTNNNYYLITSGGEQGLRIQKLNSNSNGFSVSQTKAYAFWEVDKYNLGSTGREFYGEEFNDLSPSRSFMFNFNDIIPNTSINYKIAFANTLNKGNYQKLRLSLNGNIIGESGYLYGVVEDYFYGKDNTLYFSSISDGTQQNVVQIRLLPGKSNVGGFLNYIEIDYLKNLNAYNDQLFIYTKDTTGNLIYNIKNFTNSLIKIYDITDFDNVKEIVPLSISGGEAVFSINVETGKIRKIIALTRDKFLTPNKAEQINFKDLKSEVIGAKYIIITHKNFKAQAERLKTFKETQSRFPISTMVVDVEDIINEFANGLNDPTAIRNYLKWAYENFQQKPEYVLFFGDCTYDFRNIEGKGNNFVPTYQLEYSLDIIYSWATDDYFCNVVGNANINSMTIDIIPGRIPCRTESEAKAVVDKIIAYDGKIIPGNWKNSITLVADDHYRPGNPDDGGSEFEFTYQSEQLAEYIIPPLFSVYKLYSIRYPFENTSLGRRRPLVNKAIIDAINNGTLIVNYIGHGSPDLWADEQIFDISLALPQMKNDKLFFLCAATCDFGYFDFIEKQSAAEKLLLNEKYGIIAGIAFNRPVFGNDNAIILYHLFDSLFRYDKNLQGYFDYNKSAGLGVFKLKQVKVGFATQKLIYFGDPTLVLQVPRYYVSIDSVNGQMISSDEIKISALQDVKINASSLNITKGVGETTVLDAYRQEFIKPLNKYIKDKGGVIYRGKATIKNGKIEDKFIVPKDISYSDQKGKVFVYFYDENSKSDGIGVFTNIKLDGLDTTKTFNDTKGPKIEIFFDNIGNSFGRIVNSNLKLLIKLEDESGINTTGLGLGHKLEAIINDEEKNSIDLSQYYVSDLDSYGKSGLVEYNLSNLKPGKNKIKIIAWDILNNYSMKEVEFLVVEGNQAVLSEVYNYPNPFNSNTYFVFQHNLAQINAEIKIYTIAGRCIKTIKQYGISDRYVRIFWDGKDENYNNIANGVYFYKVKINSSNGEQTAEKIGKLTVIK